MNKHGENVSKLIMKFVIREAIPIGGGFSDGVEFFTNPQKREDVLKKAEENAIKAIELIKSSPDNPYGRDDEKIAEVLLIKINERMARK